MNNRSQNKTAACLALDLYAVKPYLKSALWVFCIGAAIGFAVKSPLMPGFMSLVMLTMLASYPFAVTEKSGLETLCSVVPATRRDVIAGRYLFALTVVAAAALFSFLFALIIDAVYRLGGGVAGSASLTLALASMGLAIVAIQYPVCFRYGYGKSRIAAMIPLLVLSLGVALVGTFLPGAIDKAVEALDGPLLMTLLPVGGAVLLAVSALLSARVYANREF